MSGTFANTAGIGFTAIVQVLSVPVLTSAWGVEKYGVWLMLTTIPTYFALSDLGFTAAATSDMTMQIARGARDQALRTFQSLFVLVAATSLFMVGLASLIFLLPNSSYGVLPNQVAANTTAIFLLFIYSALILSSRITLTGFRATGYYSRGMLVYNGFFFAEGLLLLLVAWLGGGFLACIVAELLFRVVTIITFQTWLRRLVPWLRLGVAHASFDELKRLFRPAMAAMAIPTALALNLQGIVLVVGAVISPTAAATLVPVRTAGRLIIQVIGTVNRASMPELSSSIGRADRAATAKLLLVNLASITLILVPGAVAFAVFGPTIVAIWTNGHVRPDALFVALMAAGMILHGLWYFGTNLLLAANAHTQLAGSLLLASLGSIILAVPAAQFFGLNGVACALALAEAVSLFLVLREFARRDLVRGTELRRILKYGRVNGWNWLKHYART